MSKFNGHLKMTMQQELGEENRYDSLPADIRVVDADKVLNQLGTMPLVTLGQCLLINTCWIAFAFQTMMMVFITELPQFYCADVTEDTTNTTYLNFTNKCTPSVEQCGLDNATHYVYKADDIRTIASEFHLMCDPRSVWNIQLGSVIFMIGGACAMLIMTQLSDMFGRRLVFVGSFTMFAVCCTLAALAPTYGTFVICRFLSGVFSVGLTGVSWVYTCEITTMKARAVVPLGMNITWTIGYFSVGLLAMFIHDWRTLMICASVPFLPVFAMFWLLPESLHWLVAKEKRSEVKAWITSAEKWTCTKVNISECIRDTEVVDIDSDADDETDDKTVHHHKRSVLNIFKSPILLHHTIIFSYLGITANAVYWGLSLFSKNLSADRFTGFFLSAAIEVPAGILGPMLLPCFGRKTISIWSFGTTAVAMILLVWAPDEAVYTITLSLIAKFGNMIVFSSAYLLMPEVYPTTLRNVSYGLITTVAKLGSALAPYAGALSTISKTLPPAVFGIMSLIAALLCFLLPETANRQLPEDITDCQPGPVLKRLLPEDRYHSFTKRKTLPSQSVHNEQTVPLTRLADKDAH